MPALVRLLALVVALAASSAHAAINYIGRTQGGAASGSLALTPPSGTAGDILIATIVVRPSSAVIGIPSGWTKRTDTVQSSDVTMRMATYYKFTTSASEGSTTWTLGGAHTGIAGAILRFSGVDTTTPFDVADTTATSSAGYVHTAPSITPVSANTVLVTSHAFFTSSTWTPPAGMTELADVASIPTPDVVGISMEMNMELRPTAGATGTRAATALNASPNTDPANGISHSRVLRPATTSCNYQFADDFNRASLGANWVTSTGGGGFTPTIVGNRLRLTDTGANETSGVAFAQLLNTASNVLTFEFDVAAYSGSGGDGTALVLGDAGVAGALGADGGSLGYAQKTGVNGYAGGWVGVGIDELGGFASASEGRNGGPGTVIDSVTVRGSYSGTTPGTGGYVFHRNSGTLSPGVDLVAGSGSISFQGAGTAAAASEADSGNVTPTLPTHQTGDLLLCAVTSNDNVVHSVSTSGWTQLYQFTQSGSFHPRASVWYKLATSAAETAPTITHAGGSGIVSRCTGWRGVDSSSPFDVAWSSAHLAETTNSNVTTGSMTTVTANAMMVFVGHINNNRCNLTASVTGGLTWAQAFCDDRDPTGSGNDETVAMHYATDATAGAIGPITFTQSSSDANRGALIALRPASIAPAGHRYRVTLDYSNNSNAYIKVERDITASGISYTTVISQYDARAESGQVAMPSFLNLALTAANGASTDIHEIDNLRICSTQPLITPTLHHVRLLHDGSGTPGIGETVTAKACGDANCTYLYPGPVTIDLGVTGDQTWSSDPLSFSGGQTTVTLGKATGGTLTLGGTVTSPGGAGTTRCFNGATETCTFVFGATGFDAVEPAGAVGDPIYTRLSGVAFGVDVLATVGSGIHTAFTGTVLVDLVNPDAASGNCGDTAAGLTTATTYAYVAGDAGRRTFNFTYAQAAAKVKVRVRTSPATTVYCSNDAFAIRPQAFAVGATLPSSPTVLAGTGFTLTANPGVTSGYVGTPGLDVAKINTQSGVAIVSGAMGGAFAAATGGSATGAFEYHDVGTIQFLADAVTDTTFTAIDQGKTPVHCIAGSTSNTLSTGATPGRYGCNIGSTASAVIGRFIPAYFDTDIQPACPSTFVFSRQPFTAVVTAKSISGQTTQNYASGTGLANAVTLSDGNAFAGGSMTNTAVAATAFAAGVATKTDPTYSFTTEPTVPTTIRLRAVESGGDGVTSNVSTVTYPLHVEDEVEVRSGRFLLHNAFGDPRLSLALAPAQVQTWASTSYWINDTNSCTTVPVPTLANGGLSFAGAGALGSGAVSIWIGAGQPAITSTSGGALSSVKIGTTATAGPSAVGYVTVDLSAIAGWPAWLPQSTDTARFSWGLYKQNDRVIYRREIR